MTTAFLPADHHPDCYPSEPEKALAFFREAFALQPTVFVPAAPAELPLGVITPHIDFRVSLRAHAAAFRPLLEVPPAEIYVILGVGHQSRLEWNLDGRDYETPLGRVTCARDLVEALGSGAKPARFFEPAAHAGEHSIEFALLWLQALHQLHPTAPGKPFRFVPLLCGGLQAYLEGLTRWEDLADLHHLSRTLAEIFREHGLGGRLRVIVSIDGCHLGPRFHHPFEVTPPLLEATAGWETLLWREAAKGDARGFLDWMREEGNDRYFDGVGALALLLSAGAGKFRLQRTCYEQWFTKKDASAVTFSSGLVRGV